MWRGEVVAAESPLAALADGWRESDETLEQLMHAYAVDSRARTRPARVERVEQAVVGKLVAEWRKHAADGGDDALGALRDLGQQLGLRLHGNTKRDGWLDAIEARLHEHPTTCVELAVLRSRLARAEERARVAEQALSHSTPTKPSRSIEDDLSASKTGLARPVPAPTGASVEGTDSALCGADTSGTVLCAAQTAINVASWNVRKFTYKDRDEDAVRVAFLADELTYAGDPPHLLFLQEVQVGAHGERAVEELVHAVAERAPTCRLRFQLSAHAGNNERYAVVWDAGVLGDEPPYLELWSDPLGDDGLPFGLAIAATDRAALEELWRQTADKAAFARMPLLARFRSHPAVFCTVHLSADESKAVWAVAEALSLQALCLATSAGDTADPRCSEGVPMVLCGDFNEDQCSHGQWSEDGRCEVARRFPRLAALQDRFFRSFHRCIARRYATNLYPLFRVGKHNDNLWISGRHFDLESVLPVVGPAQQLYLYVTRRVTTQSTRLEVNDVALSVFTDHRLIHIILAPIEVRRSGAEAEAEADADGPAAAGTGTAERSTAHGRRDGPVDQDAPGTIRRPRGRAPKGQDWDPAEGKWVPTADAADGAHDAPKPGADVTVPSYFRQPRGRPPKGKTWDTATGVWQDVGSASAEAPAEARASSGGSRSSSSQQHAMPPAMRPVRRPPGRPPTGKVWDGVVGEYV